MKNKIILKVVLSIFLISGLIFALSTAVFADDGWKLNKYLRDVNFNNTGQKIVKYNGIDFVLLDYTLWGGFSTDMISFEDLREEGYEYKLVWRAKIDASKKGSTIDGRQITSTSWSNEYTTYGLSLSWQRTPDSVTYIDYIGLYRRNVSKSPWVYQGEMNYTGVDYTDNYYEHRKWDSSKNMFSLRYCPPYNVTGSFNREISFKTLKQNGYEYKLMWRGKSERGTNKLNGRLLSTEWSPEYTTYGLDIPWTGIYPTQDYIDYVKVYARKLNIYSESLAYWEFENGSVKDSSSYENHASVIGSVPNNEPGVVNECLKLDGNSYIEIPNSSELNLGDSDFSVSFWYKTNSSNFSIDRSGTFNGKKTGYKIISSGDALITTVYSNGYKYHMYCPGILKDNQWHHVVVTYNTDAEKKRRITYYIDSEIKWNFTKFSSGDYTLYNTLPLKIGKNFIGSLDEIVLYDRAIKEMEIYNLYQYGKTDESESTKKKLDISFDNVISDSSIYKNNVAASDGFLPKFEEHMDLYKNAAVFDGQKSVKVSDSSTINLGTGDFTISCWFKTSSTKNNNPLIDKRVYSNSKQVGYHMMVYFGKGILFQMGDSNKGYYNYIYNGTTNLNDGKWHHVTVAVDRDNSKGVKIYVDGELKYSGNATYRQGNINNSKDLLIGGDYFDTSKNFEGSIDDVKLYSRALTEDDIKKVHGVKKKWNYIIYMDGDNDLEDNLLLELQDYDVIDFEKDINILALLDRIPGCDDSHDDWTGTKLLKISKDQSCGEILCAEVLKDYGELDMGDPTNLENLIKYCQNNYPAQKTMLSIANHGGGTYGICWDDTSGTRLTIPNLKQALVNAKAATGKKIDILFMNACLMNTLDVLYQLKDTADYIVASEFSVMGLNFDENLFMQNFNQNAEGSTEDVLNAFMNNKASNLYNIVKTKNNNFSPFISDFNNFLDKVLTYGDDNDYLLMKIIYEDMYKVDEDFHLIDLIDFVKQVSQKTGKQQIKTAAQDLINELSSLEIYHEDSRDWVNGISIYFPSYQNRWKYARNSYKQDFDLAKDTKWDEFLDKYWGL